MSEQLIRTKVRKQPKRSAQAATCPTLSSVAVSANPGINTLPAFPTLSSVAVSANPGINTLPAFQNLQVA